MIHDERIRSLNQKRTSSGSYVLYWVQTITQIPSQNRRAGPKVTSLSLDFNSLNITNIEETIAKLDINRSVKRTDSFHGGTGEAEKLLNEFLNNKLDLYPQLLI